jgi:ADP-ribose pyrophosphatase YjhB (NUDIX family)
LIENNPERRMLSLPTLADALCKSMNNDERSRTYPTRPYLAVSAAIFRDGRVLIVRRARPPAHGLYTLPGGGVELGETLEEAVVREVREETSLEVEPVALAGYRQAIAHDAQGAVERHFVILPFAARWISGEVSLNEELGEAHWLDPAALSKLETTEGLALIVDAAMQRLAEMKQ